MCYSFMGISQSLPMTGYIKMIDIWMIFTMSNPFLVISLHCLQQVKLESCPGDLVCELFKGGKKEGNDEKGPYR